MVTAVMEEQLAAGGQADAGSTCNTGAGMPETAALTLP
jgi:hypothetical protein